MCRATRSLVVNVCCLLRTSRLAGDGLPDGGAAGRANGVRLAQTLFEEVLVSMTVVGSRNAAGQRRQGDGSKSSLHRELKVVVLIEVVDSLGNECPLNE
jgi:hypothetical protein